MILMRNKDKTLEHLQELLERIPQVRAAGRDSPDFALWYEESHLALSRAFGDESRHWQEFRYKTWLHDRSRDDKSTLDPNLQLDFKQLLAALQVRLRAIIVDVRNYWHSDDAEKSLVRTDVLDTSKRKVFVIHGHDGGARHELARFLRELELDPVILSERPSRGNTIIEKLDEYAAVTYAVALLTADDVGSSQQESTPKPRARQNVIFELGYFVGRLGRGRVCALTKGKPEIPSDYAGVVYIQMDSGHWQSTILGELREAGFEIDANKVF